MDIGSLIEPTVDAPPCGPNLEYDPDYLELDRISRGRPAQEMGETVNPGEPPRWLEVRDRASALLLRSKDLRVACILTQAWLRTEGLPGLLAGLDLIHGLLDRYWDNVHPALDADDKNDATMRMNALAPFASPTALIRDLRDVAVVSSRQHGTVLVRDIEVALKRLPARAGVPVLTQAQIESIWSAAMAEEGATPPPAGSTLAAARKLAALLDDKAGSAQAVDLKPLIATLTALAQFVPDDRGHAPAASEEAPRQDEQPTDAPQEVSMPPNAEIRSRQDALAMLDKVVRYLEANEPTSPVPLLLRRSMRFMGMNFIDIVKEIAPESLEKVNMVTGPGGTAS